MPEYDEFAATYQRWSATASPYAIVETYTFFQVLGSVRGLDVLDLAAGEGRTSRMLIEHGARSVLGCDVSPEMVRRATEQNTRKSGEPIEPRPRFEALDARDETFRLDRQVDRVTAMYLFHYAPSEDDLERMGRLIARNLRPGGRFVTYTLNPGYDFARRERRLPEQFGFDYRVVDGPHCELIIGGRDVDIWQWSSEAHETRLGRAGLTQIRWHPLEVPSEPPELGAGVAWYLANPSCIVLSATKPQ